MKDEPLYLQRRREIFNFLGEMVEGEIIHTSVGVFHLIHHPGIPPEFFGMIQEKPKNDGWITEKDK